MKAKTCLDLDTATLPYGVKLIQNGHDNFTVVYGLQVKKGLSYTASALELGCCIMHALACEGVLDNR